MLMIFRRALEMGVSSDSFTPEKSNYLKDLELAGHAIVDVQEKPTSVPPTDTGHVLLLGFGDESEKEKEGFTLVV
jgi:hypothetical protein